MRTLLLLATLLAGCTTTPPRPQPTSPAWKQLPPLPDKEGFAGTFAGVSHNTLLVAGGANFPDRKPWQGGTKTWYDTVYALDAPTASWRVAGHLPHPLAYGVSVTHRDSVICVGGSDSTSHHATTFRLTWTDSHLITTDLPPLPKPLANACAALLGDTLYVVGGLDAPDAAHTSRAAYRLDLATPTAHWEEVPSLSDHGRMLATAATFDGALYILGGTDLTPGPDNKPQRRYLTTALRYDPAHGWTQIADLPHPAVAAPSPAPTDASGFYLLRHDDGSQLATPPDHHSGFNNAILHYNPHTNRWTTPGHLPHPAVTTPCVPWHNAWIIPSGEIRPGIRSPEVWRWTPPTKD